MLPVGSTTASSISLNVKQSKEDGKTESVITNILAEIETNQKALDNYKQARETIKSLGILEANQSNLQRPTLTAQVKQLTGLNIHAAENYKTAAEFNSAVASAISALNISYQGIKTINDRLRFLQCSLRYSGCIEGRITEISDYAVSHDSLCGILKSECMRFNLKHGRGIKTGIHFNDFLAYLISTDFFSEHSKQYKVAMSNFSTHVDIQYLVKLGLLLNGTIPLVTTRILESLTVYDTELHHTGKNNFKKYLLEFCDLSLSEREQIDTHLTAFIQTYPKEAAII